MNRRRKSCYRPYEGKRWPLWRKAVLALLLAGALAFGALFGAVMYGAYDHIQGEPRLMVILGCQVKPWGPSILLQDRLDKALDYLEEHPDVQVVVSGGQGPDEPTTEAQAMYDYLTEHGVEPERIWQEDQSHNTWQNVRYTLALLEEMLSCVFRPWEPWTGDLYRHIPGKAWQNPAQWVLPPLLRELESDPKYAFLWDAVEFRALIARYRARCAAAQERA